MKFESVDAALDFAIQREQEAADLYTGLAERAEHEHMKEVFLGFAAEEKGHKAKLLAVKSGKQMAQAEKKIQDLKIGDYLVEMDVSSRTDLSYQDALIYAMKAEKAAFKLYTDLAASTDDANLTNTFLALAQEEAKHKLRFEVEYDEYILREN